MNRHMTRVSLWHSSLLPHCTLAQPRHMKERIWK